KNREGSSHNRRFTMKALALSAAALALALTAFTAPASAQFFGGGGFSSTSTSTSTDFFGNRRTGTRRTSDNGFTRCRSITVNRSDGLGDNASRTIRQCRPDF